MTNQNLPVPVERDERADQIIRKHMAYSMVGGAIPVPILDLTAVTAVQLDMLRQLAKNYDAPFDGQSSRTFMTSLTSALTGATLARVTASFAKFIPGIGAIGGGIGQVAITGATTYAVGSLFKRLFKERRPLDELDMQAVREEFHSYFERGKDVARSLKDKVTGARRKK